MPATEIRRLGWRCNHIPAELHQVLRRRSPERLGPIVAHLLDDVGGGRAWRTVRPLVRDGVVPRPDRPSYTIAMLAATADGSAAELIANDPGLLDVEVWRQFEVEGGGEDSLASGAAAIECDRPNRWAVSLADVAASSGGHAIGVADAIARKLPALTERPPAKLVPLLRLLDELVAAADESGPLRAGVASLERLAGSGGQAGRLARSILSRG